ncbi:DUF262 domain-containing protein [Sorangium sp. KYC3313]|uniref:DUF262 domain-containing protein n=1 Tax=Sorangium sp. KYC3313 TaxID=3449740 RepID=UPI003F889F8C
MKANAVPLLAIFEKKMRLEVPLFQRQYVWSQDDQWLPLWEDICRKFTEYLEGRKDAPVHFLGAMVLDQKQTPTTHVEKRQVIDGQQRLTTLQIFLAAFRDLCRESTCEELAKECDSFTLNKGMMAEPDADRFKVWPTLLDRQQFKDVIGAGSRAALEEKHPRQRRKYQRHDDPRPRMVEAYLYFHDQLREFFFGVGGEPPIAADQPLAVRVEECFQALKNALQVVVIDLEGGDDAQVIFETLNARGEPLLPADLLRNFIFLRAARQGESQEALYEEYWRRFDDDFWRQEVKQGRLLRPRSDLFMQHFLASRQTADIPITHLFVEYKFWIERKRPYATVREELATLARQGDDFRRIIDPKKDDILFPLTSFLDAFDIRTAYPLLLHLLDARTTESHWRQITVLLESYLLRRAVCGLNTKNYNRVFLTLTRSLRRDGTTPENVRKHLAELSGESTGWPSDDEFRTAWQERATYQTLAQPRVVHILRRLSDALLSGKSERISIDGPLTIEHILPQSWIEHWPLADGTAGMTADELVSSDATDPRAVATRRRSAAIHTLGNLTILTQALNSTVSNSAWKVKKPELLVSSLLPINQQLHTFVTWDESSIEVRGRALFDVALKLWPGPTAA